jgi:hypothetical protein
MMRINVRSDGRVECRALLELPLPPGVVWGQLRDFRRFASHDYFHAGIDIEAGIPRRGAALRLTHRYLFVSIPRVGRILRWREWNAETASGEYAFSDVSLRGPRHGFPHVLSYRLRGSGVNHSQLQIIVRGRWTARWLARGVTRIWLWWVFAHVVARVRNDFAALAMSRQSQRIHRTITTAAIPDHPSSASESSCYQH